MRESATVMRGNKVSQKPLHPSQRNEATRNTISEDNQVISIDCKTVPCAETGRDNSCKNSPQIHEASKGQRQKTSEAHALARSCKSLRYSSPVQSSDGYSASKSPARSHRGLTYEILEGTSQVTSQVHACETAKYHSPTSNSDTPKLHSSAQKSEPSKDKNRQEPKGQTPGAIKALSERPDGQELTLKSRASISTKGKETTKNGSTRRPHGIRHRLVCALLPCQDGPEEGRTGRQLKKKPGNKLKVKLNWWTNGF